ncbi:putative thioredoxin [Lineolata rhizophorae]|uniref:Putative thioredoxin n=1 Tax=Lineolata rhizophorae TaxID=578093 RepID=A0A6A6NZ11_9PEZI|nr:putative thioredoxin [Lineolata rhizophorae]
MSKVVHISSPEQFSSLLASSRIVVVDFFAEWCGPCKAIAPLYEQLAARLSRHNSVTFTKVDTDKQTQIAGSYSITAMPTFVIIKNGHEVSRIEGANPQQLSDAVRKLAAEAEAGASSSSAAGGFASGPVWRGANLPRGYHDVTDEVDRTGLELLNSDSDFGAARVLLDPSEPSALKATGNAGGGKGKGKAEEPGEAARDWVQSDTDEQLMLFLPFNATLKAHTIHITSLPPVEADEDEVPMRPRTIRIYTNRPHNLGFEEADDTSPTQAFELGPDDWDGKTGTAKLELRFVKFQNITSLVLFVVDGDGDGEKVRIDRVRIIGESGEKRTMGKLEKIGDDP